MQSKILLIGVTSSELLFPEHFCNYFEQNIAYFSKGILGRGGGGCLPQWGPAPRMPKHF